MPDMAMIAMDLAGSELASTPLSWALSWVRGALAATAALACALGIALPNSASRLTSSSSRRGLLWPLTATVEGCHGWLDCGFARVSKRQVSAALCCASINSSARKNTPVTRVKGSCRHRASSRVKMSSLNRSVILINKFQVLGRLRIVYGCVL